MPRQEGRTVKFGGEACRESGVGSTRRGTFSRAALVFSATGRPFPWHARPRFQRGERGCTGPPFEGHAWKLLLLAGRSRLLVLHEGVCLMTAHTRLAFHERIRLQLCHLIAVAAVACADCRRASEVLCCCLAVAHGAFDTVGGMRAGFPLVIDRLVAGGTGIPGWNQPMVNMLGLIQLRHGRLDGNSQNEKSEQAEDARRETIHGQTS